MYQEKAVRTYQGEENERDVYSGICSGGEPNKEIMKVIKEKISSGTLALGSDKQLDFIPDAHRVCPLNFLVKFMLS